MSTRADAPDLPADWLHTRVCGLRLRTRRRAFDAVLLLSLYDDARGAASGALHLVVTRPGPVVLETSDLAWRFAWATACAVAGDEAGTTAVVTRYGFVDVASGACVRTPLRRHRR